MRRKWMRGLVSNEKPVTDYVTETFGDFYKESNFRLMARRPELDLTDYPRGLAAAAARDERRHRQNENHPHEVVRDDVSHVCAGNNR